LDAARVALKWFSAVLITDDELNYDIGAKLLLHHRLGWNKVLYKHTTTPHLLSLNYMRKERKKVAIFVFSFCCFVFVFVFVCLFDFLVSHLWGQFIYTHVCCNRVILLPSERAPK
jgi:hypothetical protein